MGPPRVDIDIDTLHLFVDIRHPYLERNEPNAFDRIPNQQQVFEHAQAGDIDANVQKRHAHKALVKVKRPDKYLVGSRQLKPRPNQ